VNVPVLVRDIEAKIASGAAIGIDEARQLLEGVDLLTLGALGDSARRARTGDRVTYGRVCILAPGPISVERGEAGEVRLTGTPASVEEARERVHAAHTFAAGVPLTGFSLADLLTLMAGDHLALADLARVLRADGLDAIAEIPIDELGDTENAVEVVRAIQYGGLGAWRATIGEAVPEARLDLIERTAVIQRETGALRAFAPLPRRDPVETPATGFDDVKTIAIARLTSDIPAIQVDWPLYGPKLAQVAVTYGANDIDGVASVDTLQLGHRRSPREDVERQIRAASAVPAERDGRYGLRV
jgi:hypothetical protein